MDSFFMTLPSNVKTNADENAVSHYRTTLASPIYLDREYEVALVECTFPRDLAFQTHRVKFNLGIVAGYTHSNYRRNKNLVYQQLDVNEQIRQKSQPREEVVVVTRQGESFVTQSIFTPFSEFYHTVLKPEMSPWTLCYGKLWKRRSRGHLGRLIASYVEENYEDVESLVNECNNELRFFALNHKSGKPASFQLLPNGKVKINPGFMTRLDGDANYVNVYFPTIDEPAASILGLSKIMQQLNEGFVPYTNITTEDSDEDDDEDTQKPFITSNNIALTGTKIAAFPDPYQYLLYSNLVKHSICGENFFQLLRQINIPAGNSPYCNIVYSHPYYQPLAVNPIVDITLEFRDLTGDYANFANYTRSCVVLHFREKQNAHFKSIKETNEQIDET